MWFEAGTGVWICVAIIALWLGATALFLFWVTAFHRGYEAAQRDLTVELLELAEQITTPLDHIDGQRLAAREGRQ